MVVGAIKNGSNENEIKRNGCEDAIRRKLLWGLHTVTTHLSFVVVPLRCVDVAVASLQSPQHAPVTRFAFKLPRTYKNLPRICQEFAKNLPRICQEFAKNLPRIAKEKNTKAD